MTGGWEVDGRPANRSLFTVEPAAREKERDLQRQYNNIHVNYSVACYGHVYSGTSVKGNSE